jgi:hypothetical protein
MIGNHEQLKLARSYIYELPFQERLIHNSEHPELLPGEMPYERYCRLGLKGGFYSRLSHPNRKYEYINRMRQVHLELKIKSSRSR